MSPGQVTVIIQYYHSQITYKRKPTSFFVYLKANYKKSIYEINLVGKLEFWNYKVKSLWAILVTEALRVKFKIILFSEQAIYIFLAWFNATRLIQTISDPKLTSIRINNLFLMIMQ